MAREAVLAVPQAERSRMTLLDPQPRPLDDPGLCADAELIDAVRAGDRAAYAELYRRHEPAARRTARQLSPSPYDVDDLVAEAFARVFDMLRSGRGPDSAFRAYLLTAVRNGMYERARRDRRLEFSDDMARHDQGVPWVDPAEAELNSALAAQAFASLPERWRTVLWYSEVEQESTAEVGSRLGLRPNAVAALAYRAREGLRQAFLQAHVNGCADETCRETVARLGGWTRDRLSAGDTDRVDAHLADCRRCRQVAAELDEVNSGLRGLLLPLVLGGAATGPLASLLHVPTGVASAGAASTGAASAGAGVASAGAVSAGAASAGVVSGGAAAAGGSVLGWLAGAYAGPAAAVLTAVVVGGTAVAAGVAVPHAVHRSTAPGTVTSAEVDNRSELAPINDGGPVRMLKKNTSTTSKAAAKAAKKQAKAAEKAAKKAAGPGGPGGQPKDPQADAAGNGQTEPKDSQADASGNGQTEPKDSQADASGNGQTEPKDPQADASGNGQTEPKDPQASTPGSGRTKLANPQADALGSGQTEPKNPNAANGHASLTGPAAEVATPGQAAGNGKAAAPGLNKPESTMVAGKAAAPGQDKPENATSTNAAAASG